MQVLLYSFIIKMLNATTTHLVGVTFFFFLCPPVFHGNTQETLHWNALSGHRAHDCQSTTTWLQLPLGCHLKWTLETSTNG